MEKLIDGSARRLIAFLIGTGALILNKKFGLELGPDEQAAMVTLISVYLAQGAYTSAAKAKAQAQADGELVSRETVLAELKKGVVP